MCELCTFLQIQLHMYVRVLVSILSFFGVRWFIIIITVYGPCATYYVHVQ